MRLDHLLDLDDDWITLGEDEGGVPTYLLVEPGPPVILTELVLCNDDYRTVAEHDGYGPPVQLGAPG